jgi:Mn-dependent DtxR family transcriptional regulator
MDAADLDPGTTTSDVVELLYDNPKRTYAVADVADRLDISQEDAAATLTRLYRSDLVGQATGGQYYALTEREELRRYCAATKQTRMLFETYR